MAGCRPERLCDQDAVRSTPLAQCPFARACQDNRLGRWTIQEDKSKLQLPPKVIVDGDDSQKFIYRKVKPSEVLEFDASASQSRNGGDLSFRWFLYKEIDSFEPVVSLHFHIGPRCRWLTWGYRLAKSPNSRCSEPATRQSSRFRCPRRRHMSLAIAWSTWTGGRIM